MDDEMLEVKGKAKNDKSEEQSRKNPANLPKAILNIEFHCEVIFFSLYKYKVLLIYICHFKNKQKFIIHTTTLSQGKEKGKKISTECIILQYILTSFNIKKKKRL